jgi:hypothetical protein
LEVALGPVLRPELSSNVLQWTTGGPIFIGAPISLASSNNFTSGSNTRNASKIVIYSDLTDDSAASLCNFDPQDIGHPAQVIMNRVLNLAVIASKCMPSAPFTDGPRKLTSTQHSNRFVIFGI